MTSVAAVFLVRSPRRGRSHLRKNVAQATVRVASCVASSTRLAMTMMGKHPPAGQCCSPHPGPSPGRAGDAKSRCRLRRATTQIGWPPPH